MIFIKLMPDYNCHPLWHYKSKDVGNINPENLPISKDLVNALNQWATVYDSILDKVNPLNSGFKTKEEELMFVHKGASLARLLQKELGKGYKVFFYNIILKKLIETGL